MAQKVLLIRFSAMGDCITTTWAATAIRNAWPDAEIVWAIEKQYADLVDVGRLVDRVHLFDGFRRGFRSRLAACLDLRRERFDFGVDFQGSTRTNLCLNLIAPRVKVSARKLKEGPAHEIGRSFELISPLGSFEIPDLPIMPRCADERLTIRKKSPRKRPLVTIQMGSSSPDRAYPAQLWSAVAAGLAEYGVTVVTIGGPGDPGIQCAGVTDLVGMLSLKECLAAVAESDIHLAADTGTGHVAAAYGVRAVSVFGPSDPGRYRPWTRRGTVLQRGTSTAAVSPKEVIDATIDLLEERQLALFD